MVEYLLLLLKGILYLQEYIQPEGYTNGIHVYMYLLCLLHFFSFCPGNERSTCIAMRTQTPAGIWENKPCNQKNNFLCQYPRKGYTPVVVTQTPPPSGSCPTGWTPNWDKCYKVWS